jgi:hypothetical protein
MVNLPFVKKSMGIAPKRSTSLAKQTFENGKDKIVRTK